MKFIYLFVILNFLVCSCKTEDKKNESIFSEWLGRNIVFPSTIQFSQYGHLVIDSLRTDKKYKVLTYVDSIGCIACKLKMHLWKDIIKEFQEASKDNVSFIFVINANNYKDVRYILKESDFNYPVFFDNKDTINKLNKFPQKVELQTFLLDSNNNVILIGNPTFSIKIKDLYLKQLTGMQEKETLPATTLEAEQSEYDLGTVKEGTTKQQVVTVQNTGTTVFRLKGFTTSCDCTGATAEWKELHPGDRGTITVSYEAEQPGDFYRTVEIYGNIPNNSLQLSFIGTVK